MDLSHVEPAHPQLVQLQDTLVAIYKLIREKYQDKIDAAFDQVARQIGYVVTTTVPVEVEIGKGGSLQGVTLAENLKGTLFESVAKAVGGDSVGKNVAPGKVNLYLVWYAALKMKLRTDFMEPAHFFWMEPAHPSTGGVFGSMRAQLSQRFTGNVPFHGEPVHWFDPGYQIAADEAIMISAMDEVYPEFRLADRIRASRAFGGGKIGPIGPGPREMVPFAASAREQARFFGPGVREPAHVRPEVMEPAHLPADKAQQFAAELSALLKKFGF